MALGLVAGAVALRLLYGQIVIGYDTGASLLWGHDLAHGRLPDFTTPFSPTPHPLAYLVLVVAAPFGEQAQVLVQMIGFISFAFLGWAAFRLGAVLYSPAIGILFAAILLTRPLLVGETLHAFVDIPCLALILMAAATEAERPRRGWPVLVLLSLAGLLRPEAWLLAAAYAAWMMPGRTWRARAVLVLAAASAPLVWALLDLVIAGDPLFSLHSTQHAAARLDRPQGLGSSFERLPVYLSDAVEDPVVWLGVAGVPVCLALLYDRSLIPLAILVLGLGSFLVLGVADLPLLKRYLLPAAAMLALFCSAAALGWRLLRRGDRWRTPWIGAAVLVAAVLVASVPDTVRGIRDARAFRYEIQRAQSALLDLVYTPAVQAAARRCPRVFVPDQRLGAPLARAFDRRLGDVEIRHPPTPADRGLIVLPRAPRARSYYVFRQRFRIYSRRQLAGFRRIDFNGLWAVWTRC